MKMDRVIKGKRYNTDTAEYVCRTASGSDTTKFNYRCETLYRKRGGEYFLHCEGGPNTKYGVWHGNSGGAGEMIKPLDEDEAREFVSKYADAETYAKYFEIDENGDKVGTTIYLSPAAKKKLQQKSVERKITASELIERLIKKM